MAHCAIYIKGSNEIAYFIRDCDQSGRDYKGSNGSVTGVKEHLFDAKWTDDIASPVVDKDGNQTGFSCKVSELSEARRYQGQVVSTEADINAVTRELIASRYSLTDEIKIIRQKLSGDDTEWKEYRDYVESLVASGRAFKEVIS